MTQRRDQIRAAFLLLCAGLVGALLIALHQLWHAPPGGTALNRMAWEASYRERGLVVPAGGPAEGYWGEALPPHVPHPKLGWRSPTVSLPGRVEIDAEGLRRAGTPPAEFEVAILGGSVAGGAYASRLDLTYFQRLQAYLAQRGFQVHVTVCAAGSWTSEHELPALELLVLPQSPDLVVLLDGLNDLTQRRDVPPDRRVSDYLARMKTARDLALAHGAGLVYAPQPYPHQKQVRSLLEERIMELSVEPQVIRHWYPRLIAGLAELTDPPRIVLLDCSRVFDAEPATTFADIWHFADPGHQLLARRLEAGLVPVLERLRRGG